ncbi:hypothetical protein [Pseudomonas sp. CGJS7]|uniref:hypothetical protein n=1 Tax=Pseudomonas sp. CGJS7 TaxID=3109348 RepID=UPI00300BE0AF
MVAKDPSLPAIRYPAIRHPVIPAKAGIHFDLDLGRTRVDGVEYAQSQNGFRLSPE